jgi:membrane carboxypeptidase/penicillin-binding protein
MSEALRSTPEMPFTMPAGVITALIDPKTGAPAEPGQGVSEYFFQELESGTQANEPQTPLEPARLPGQI